jgi:secreted trypsin-like serine protease
MLLQPLLHRFNVVIALAMIVTCGGCAAEATRPEGASSEDDQADGKVASTTEAITNGADDDADPTVVALLIGGRIFCTGVLVSPTVIATAGHCVDPTPPDQAYFGSDPGVKKKGTLINVSDSKVHPDFDADTLENDIALIGLASKAPTTPAPIFTGDFDASFTGKAIRLVGFGAKGFAQDTDLRKRSGTTTIESFGDDDFRFHPGPSQTCNGDSGGPAFATVDGKEVVIGLASSGDQNCVTYGRDMRIDRYAPFIKSYEKAYSTSAAAGLAPNSGCALTTHLPRRNSAPIALFLLALGVTGARARRARTRRSATLGA